MSVAPAAPDAFADIDPAAVPPAPRFLYEAARSRFLLRPARRERRKVTRFFLAAEVLARPLRADLAPAGEPFRGVIIDLSNDGLRIIHIERITSPMLVVRLGLWEDAIELVARINRAVRVGSHFEHAGRLVVPPVARPETAFVVGD